MRSRRGGTRGESSCSPTFPSPDSASPASPADNLHPHNFVGRYPDTRSGRGKAWLHSSGREAATVRTATFPLPPHPAPHTMQFRFHSSLNRPVIIAPVSITITEETKQHVPLDNPTEEANRAGPSSRNRGNNGEPEVDEGRTRRHGKAIVGSWHVEMGIHSYMQASDSRQGDMLGSRVEACSMKEGHQALGRGESDNPDD